MPRPHRPMRLEFARLEDRTVPAVVASYAVTQNWGSGFQAEVRISNPDPIAVRFDQLSFDLPANVTSLWDAKLQSRSGTNYTVTNAGWNDVIPAGGSVSFGFVASPGTVPGDATGFVFNGASVGIPTPTSNPNPNPTPTPTPTPTQGVTFRVTNDWGSGLTGEIVVANTGTSTVSGWSLAFDFPAAINSMWNAKIASQSGTRFTIAPESWNSVIPVGGSISIGFTANRGGVAATNFDFAATGSTPTPTPNPTPTPTPTPTPNPNPTPTPPPAAMSEWPTQVFAPYIDATLWPTYDFVATAQSSGLRYFTLAFITADPSGKPAWGGYSAYSLDGSEFDVQMRTQVAALRALGGDVAISFGGASNRELAEVITNVNDLTAAYRSVIEAYGLTHVDFDIEGAGLADKAAIDRRNAAIAILQQDAAAAGRELHVRYTLPVLPTGLTHDGLYLLQSAKAAGVRIDSVNIMAMDYGDSAAPNPAGKMGDYAIQAGTSLFGQLRAVYGSGPSDAALWQQIGITPMIGRNDVLTEVFDQTEARELVAWAETKGIGLLSFWSLNRDYAHPSGSYAYVNLKSSSVPQTPLEFSGIFNAFTA